MTADKAAVSHIVEVTWHDSTVNNGRWVDIDQILSPDNRAITQIRTTGYVLADDETGMVLAASVHASEASGVTHIPRGAIDNVKKLRR